MAQTAIGDAQTVIRDVRAISPGTERKVNGGDAVFQNEAISTAAQSSTNLRFRDATSLAIGPEARVVLDRFVYNADRTARRSVVSAVRGALRWTSGESRPSAYRVRTPLAAIGVRGTQFDLIVEQGIETVILRDGQVNVCLTGSDLCRSLLNPGDVAVITPGAIDTTPRDTPSANEFEQSCLTTGGCTIDTAGPGIVDFARSACRTFRSAASALASRPRSRRPGRRRNGAARRISRTPSISAMFRGCRTAMASM